MEEEIILPVEYYTELNELTLEYANNDNKTEEINKKYIIDRENINKKYGL